MLRTTRPCQVANSTSIARVFNSSPISPRKCRILLTKISLLLFTGEKFPQNEATSLFFGISKLFQNKDAALRQMVYLVIKELANTAQDVIMVTSSIMKDTAVGSDVVYRANAIRALCRIIDASTVQAIERNIKTAIVDKTPSVSSAALVSSYHLLPIARDIVRRWQSETQEAASSTKSSGGFSLGFGSSASTPLVCSIRCALTIAWLWSRWFNNTVLPVLSRALLPVSCSSVWPPS